MKEATAQRVLYKLGGRREKTAIVKSLFKKGLTLVEIGRRLNIAQSRVSYLIGPVGRRRGRRAATRHGTMNEYRFGCRCNKCITAAREIWRARKARTRKNIKLTTKTSLIRKTAIKPHPKLDRIRELAAHGATLKEIADEVGCTGEYVRLICKNHGLQQLRETARKKLAAANPSARRRDKFRRHFAARMKLWLRRHGFRWCGIHPVSSRKLPSRLRKTALSKGAWLSRAEFGNESLREGFRLAIPLRLWAGCCCCCWCHTFRSYDRSRRMITAGGSAGSTVTRCGWFVMYFETNFTPLGVG
jgi:hypothetical protein